MRLGQWIANSAGSSDSLRHSLIPHRVEGFIYHAQQERILTIAFVLSTLLERYQQSTDSIHNNGELSDVAPLGRPCRRSAFLRQLRCIPLPLQALPTTPFPEIRRRLDTIRHRITHRNPIVGFLRRHPNCFRLGLRHYWRHLPQHWHHRLTGVQIAWRRLQMPGGATDEAANDHQGKCSFHAGILPTQNDARKFPRPQ
jgi:hypothetical protein